MEPEKKKGNGASLARILVLGFAVAVFIYSGTQLAQYYLENHRNEKEQQALIDQAVVTIPNPPEQTAPAEQIQESGETAATTAPAAIFSETAPIYVDFEILRAQNPDIVGWIYCPDSRINYPIVQGQSNQDYLYRSHTGESNSNGSIFMDFRNLPDFSDFNNIIYGHNMNNGAMFGTLREYRNQSHYEQYPTMWLLTPDKAFRLDLIAAYTTPSDSDTYELYSYPEDLHGQMEYALAHSDFDAGEVEISGIQQIVTLSTCTYEYATARYVVIGSMVEVGYPEPPVTE